MRASNYNFFFLYEADTNKMIAYNSFTNALALMEKEKHEVFQNFAQRGVDIENTEFVQQLKHGGFLIDDEINELDLLRFRMLQSRYSTKSLGLTIAPTADCNFRCPYCYEKDVLKPDYMTQEVEDAIVKMVEGQVKTIAALSINWYGGEPLMNMPTIERLSRKFIEICEEHNIHYSASMISNGYLLTPEIAKLLQELKISSIQITLDGGAEIHDQRRPLADGSGTFDTIVGNLEKCKEWLPNVSLRINIDKTNTSAGKEITKLLGDKGLLDKVFPYLGRVTADSDDYDKGSCFSCGGFSEEEFRYFKEFQSSGESYMSKYPRPMSSYCGADALGSYVIAADGKLYKCWHDIGKESRCVGSLMKANSNNKFSYLNYMLYDATADSECSKCNLLPICMGGCPEARLKGAERCSLYKFALDDFVKVISQRLKVKKG